MEVINIINNVLTWIVIAIIVILSGVLFGVIFYDLKNAVKNKIRQLKTKLYAVTYLVDPKRNHIDNKNDNDIQILSFSTYQNNTRTEFFKARSKAQAIAKFYTNSDARTYTIRNFGDVLVIAVKEITFVT